MNAKTKRGLAIPHSARVLLLSLDPLHGLHGNSLQGVAVADGAMKKVLTKVGTPAPVLVVPPLALQQVVVGAGNMLWSHCHHCRQVMAQGGAAVAVLLLVFAALPPAPPAVAAAASVTPRHAISSASVGLPLLSLPAFVVDS